MKARYSKSSDGPRLVGERKPLVPVHVAPTPWPIKVTRPLGHGTITIPARRLG